MTHQILTLKRFTVPSLSVQTLVVGSGAAGLNAAAALYKEGQHDVILLTEGRTMGTSRNTGSDKQTYYKLTACGSDPDSVRQMADILFSGQAVDGDTALTEAALSSRCFYHLVDLGVPFPCNGSGEYVGYKTDHDPNQRGTSAGPLTSKFMTEALWREVDGFHIPVLDGYQLIELLTDTDEVGKRVCGAVALDRKKVAGNTPDAYLVILAENIIYATGGEAGLYETSVYPASQTGGTGVALRAGAAGKNLTEWQYGIASIKFRWNLSGTYQQVLPRYISTEPDGTDEKEFLNEYFENAEQLLNACFLKGYQWPFDPRKTADHGSSLVDLLVYQETVLRGRRVWLDFRRNPSPSETDLYFDAGRLPAEAREYLRNSDGLKATPIQRLEHMNPAAIELYRSHGIDLATEPLEIAVCAQHNNGGLAGNAWWESNLKHLFPVGEVNGSHGVYRPGGTALNAGQVGSLRAAQYITACYPGKPISAQDAVKRLGSQIECAIRFGQDALDQNRPLLDLREEKRLLQLRMSRYAACIRSMVNIETALAEAEVQRKRLEEGGILNSADLPQYYRLRDLLASQKVYLIAMQNYIAVGGASRGSYLICDECGEKPLAALPELFRARTYGTELGSKVQEAMLEHNEVRCTWRSVRPIPKEDTWFEKVWRDYRAKAYFYKLHANDCMND